MINKLVRIYLILMQNAVLMQDNSGIKFGKYNLQNFILKLYFFFSFANHSSKPNCVPKVKLVNGKYFI